MKKEVKVLISVALLIIFAITFQSEVWAQCPMCRLSAEQNLKAGGTAGRGLNTGILFLLALPYLAVGTVGYLWYKRNFNSNTN